MSEPRETVTLGPAEEAERPWRGAATAFERPEGGDLAALSESLDLGLGAVLSEESLDCVGPELHRGWEDRRFSCRRSRATTREAVGFQLDGEERRALLTLAAHRNRIFRLPPVRLVPNEIRDAFPALDSLVGRLEP